MLARVHSCALVGLQGYIVDVEVDFNPRAGIPYFTIVGLPDNAVRESRDRVRAAIKNSHRTAGQRRPGRASPGREVSSAAWEDPERSGTDQPSFGLQFPNKGYTVNLSPADLPKHGPAYDLPVAVGVLAATDQIPLGALDNALFIGELSLDGSVRHAKGILPIVHTAFLEGYETIYVPVDDAPEAALVSGIQVIPVETLGQLVEHVYDLQRISPYISDLNSLDTTASTSPDGLTDFADVKGQEHVKRALEIAAGGNHNVRMTGPPGVGKTLLARALPRILPRLTLEEALEVTRIYSVADSLASDNPLIRSRPFRAPHHTISQAGLVGGGSIPKPGEISLAHRGVLFLDEAVEFNAKTLEVLRQPIEDKIVTISRAHGTLTFPANFLLVLAMNPCPCGRFGDVVGSCTCTPTAITRYQSRLSGPLLDRIDLHVDVPRVDYDKLMGIEPSESSANVRQRVELARERQRQRFANFPGLFANGDMGASEIRQLCVLEPDARQLLDVSVRRLQLSARAYHRVLKLSRTISDLADCDTIQAAHVAEAIQYRPKHLVP